MGYTKHHAIIVTSWNSKDLKRARQRALEIFLNCQVSDIVTSPVNIIHSFFVGPDGSKEGWSDSNRGDQERDQFVEWLDSQANEDGSNDLAWVELMYKDDEEQDGITRSYLTLLQKAKEDT